MSPPSACQNRRLDPSFSRRVVASRDSPLWVNSGQLRKESQFPLVSNCQDTYLIARNHKSIQGNVSRLPVGNNQLAQFAFDAAAYQGMHYEIVNRRLDRGSCVQRGVRIPVTHKLKCALDMIKSARRIDYLRHGFGRATDSPSASRLIQACTSSAR
jgi:hypothetical protein